MLFAAWRSIGIGDIFIDSLFGQFQAKVFRDKIDSLKEYKNGLKSRLANKEIDTDAYQWAIEEIDSNCIDTIDISNFSLSPTGIEIIDQCDFPHAKGGTLAGLRAELFLPLHAVLPKT